MALKNNSKEKVEILIFFYLSNVKKKEEREMNCARNLIEKNKFLH